MMEEDFAEREATEDWTAPLEGVGNLKRTAWNNVLSSPKPKAKHKAKPNPGLSRTEDHDKGHSRVIVHFDIDCFYAQVEMLRNPALADKPVGIQQKNIIVTCNYVARSHGVTKLSYIKDAVKLCPELVLVNGEDLTHYRQMSYQITDFFLRYSSLVERLGFDENFVDLTRLAIKKSQNDDMQHVKLQGHSYAQQDADADCGCGCRRRLIIGSHLAAEMRDALRDELGITCCAGIATNKLLAKLVGSTHKPNQQTTLFSCDADLMMTSLDKVRSIPGIGHSSQQKLLAIGVTSVTDLRACPLETLLSEFGETFARTMKQLSYGADDTSVIPSGLPQSISDEDSFKSCTDVTDAKSRITGLLQNILKRLLSDGRTPGTLRLTIRRITAGNKWSGRESRQCPIPAHILHHFSQDSLPRILDDLLRLSIELFVKLVDVRSAFHLTLINVCLTKFSSPSQDGSTIMSFFKQSPKSHSASAEGKRNHLKRQDPDSECGSVHHVHGKKRKLSLDSWVKPRDRTSAETHSRPGVKEMNSTANQESNIKGGLESDNPNNSRQNEYQGLFDDNTCTRNTIYDQKLSLDSWVKPRKLSLDSWVKPRDRTSAETHSRPGVKEMNSTANQESNIKAGLESDNPNNSRQNEYQGLFDDNTCTRNTINDQKVHNSNNEETNRLINIDDRICQSSTINMDLNADETKDTRELLLGHDVDMEVFRLLPVEVQAEVMQECKRLGTQEPRRQDSGDSGRSKERGSYGLLSSTLSKLPTSNASFSSSSSTTSSSPVWSSSSSLSSSSKHSSKLISHRQWNDRVEACLHADSKTMHHVTYQHQRAALSSHHATEQKGPISDEPDGQQTLSQSSHFIPEGLDQSVFENLPKEIQAELICDWKKRRHLLTPSKRKDFVSGSGKAKSVAKTRRIMDFFDKKK